MSDDAKVDFYLANRAIIEEWAALRKPAASTLDRALVTAAHQLVDDPSLPEPQIKEEQARAIRLHVTTDPLPSAWLELWWQEKSLLRGSGGWPYLVVVMNPKQPRQLRKVVKDASAAARAHGLTSTGSQWWLRSGPVVPRSEPIDIEEYAQSCISQLGALWMELQAPIAAAVEAYTRSHQPEDT